MSIKYHTIHAYKQLTHKYNRAWSELEDEIYMNFNLRAIFGKPTRSNDGETDKSTVLATTSRRVSLEQMYDMAHYFNKSCRCEHDCCGHFNGGVYRIKQLSQSGRKWSLLTSYTRNV